MSIAMTRILKLKQADRLLDVPVRIFWPIEDKQAWDCRWEIQWPDRLRTNMGRGVDAVQALTSALQMIGAEIYCSEEHRSGMLGWQKEWSGYGFPVPTLIRDLMSGDDAKYL